LTESKGRPKFGELLEASESTACISVRADGRWIDRSTLTGEDTPEEFILRSEMEGTSRYNLRTDDGEARVEGWKRFNFPITQKIESGEERQVSDDLEIVADITDDGSIPEHTPWSSESELRLRSALLQKDSKYRPVNADRVAGLEDEKRRLERFLEDADEDWGLSESTGIILEGPPGTGKTELVMEVCQERYGSIPVIISGPEILSKWVGESERTLREKFDEAWNTEHKVLYIDELDAIAQSRSEVSESYSAQIVAQLLVLLDGVESKEQSDESDRSLKIVASTNLAHVIDPALRRPGRLGNRPIQFGRPSRLGRKAIVHHYLEDVYVSDDGQLGEELKASVERRDLECLNSIVEATEGFTGADIEDLIQESVSRLPESGRETLDKGLLEEILADRDFKPGQDFSEREFPKTELQAAGRYGIEHSPEKPAVYYLDDEDAEEVAKRYFDAVNQEQEDRELTYKFRKISPKDLLDSDPVRAREETVQAFQHRGNERLALYLENAERLLQSQERSSLIDRLVGVLNEQFLQWEEENLLLLSESALALIDDDGPESG